MMIERSPLPVVTDERRTGAPFITIAK